MTPSDNIQLYSDSYTGIITGTLINSEDFNYIREKITDPHKTYLNNTNGFIIYCETHELQNNIIEYLKDKCKSKDEPLNKYNSVLLFPLKLSPEHITKLEYQKYYIYYVYDYFTKSLAEINKDTYKTRFMNNAIAIECTEPAVLKDIESKLNITDPKKYITDIYNATKHLPNLL
jgi:hypothetical protein